MKIALTFLFLILFIGVVLPNSAFAFKATSDNQLIATFPVRVHFDRSTEGGFFKTTNGDKSTLTVIGWFRNGAGQTELRINTQDIRFDGPTNDINDLPTSLAFEWLAEEAARQAVIRGYITTSSVCSVPTMVKVLAESCVTRTWLGENTRITPCATYDMVAWQYAVCGSSTAPTVARTYYYNNFISCESVGTGCEATCPGSSQSSTTFQ